MARRRAAEPTWGGILLLAAVALFFVAVQRHWAGADRLWEWGINIYFDWRTDRKVERLERRTDRLEELFLTPSPTTTG
jgi:hypothetical protein